MEFGHLFEALMLICFGFSWPLNVIKAYKAGTAKGTSLAFIFLIITGYLAGISAKFINHQINYVLAVYFLNLAIVMLNVFVYIRNKSLDKQSAKKSADEQLRITNQQIKNINKESTKEEIMNYTYSLDEVIYPKVANAKEEKNAVILFGGTADKKLPVQSLAKEFNFNFKLYNKSQDNFSLALATDYFKFAISPLAPEGILLHLGNKDIDTFKKSSEVFDTNYLKLISEIKSYNSKCRIALISLNNPTGDKTINEMNRHIKAIAASEKCSFVNLDNAKLWNPAARKAAVDFAYSMGLKTRKPLGDVAEILYSYAYNNFAEYSPVQHLVG